MTEIVLPYSETIVLPYIVPLYLHWVPNTMGQLDQQPSQRPFPLAWPSSMPTFPQHLRAHLQAVYRHCGYPGKPGLHLAKHVQSQHAHFLPRGSDCHTNTFCCYKLHHILGTPEHTWNKFKFLQNQIFEICEYLISEYKSTSVKTAPE